MRTEYQDIKIHKKQFHLHIQCLFLGLVHPSDKQDSTGTFLSYQVEKWAVGKKLNGRRREEL